MGTYVNPGFQRFLRFKKSNNYVDKSLLIAILNKKLNSEDSFICVSRPGRFGKTMAANMIAAYYSKGCDSHEIFSNLKRKLQNSNTTSKDESLCNAIDNALNLLIEADLVL